MEQNKENSVNNEQLEKDLIQAPWMECECGCKMYDEVTMFKRLDASASPTGITEHIPATVVICRRCNLVPGWFAALVPEIPRDVITKCKKG